jgi:O-antigen/teichoic acid export membrane protein
VLGSAPMFYLSAHIDEIAIGRRFGSHQMGAYQLSYNTAALPATYLAELVSGVLFPVFARLQSTPTALRDAYLKTVRHLANICLPVSVALFVFAEECIRLVYGSRWEESIPILRAFFLYSAIRPLASASLQVFRAVGATQAIFRLGVLNLVGVCCMVFVGIPYGPIWVAILLSILSVPAVVYGWQLTAVALELRIVDILRSCTPALLASGTALAAALLARSSVTTLDTVPLRLAAGLAVVASAYVPALLLLDRHWVGEIRDLLKARWPRLVRTP